MNDHRGGPGPQLPDFSAPGGEQSGAGGHGLGAQGTDGYGAGAQRPDGQSSGGQSIGGYGATGGAGGASLPDFSGGPSDSPAEPGGSGAVGPGVPVGPGSPGGSGGGRGPMLALLGGGGCLVVILAVIALVLSQTVLSGGGEEPADDPTPSASGPTDGTGPSDDGGASDGGSGGAPTPTDQEPATEAAASGTACTMHGDGAVTEQVEGEVRGGGLAFSQPEGWEVGTGWGSQSAYVTDQHHADQPVEAGWYTLAGVGKVEFPEEEGGYPGAEEAARAIFLCALEPEQGEELYGDPAMLRDFRSEATTVDGHDAWIVSADVAISDLALLHSTDAWRRVVIVVDTPDGPAVFDGGAALGHDQQVADLEAMVEGLTVL
ncbi:hypothetical protein [Brachybacterium sp. sponge]|uniref:hypothetical protein n=1 Tax=Brachybacterium sp. sponge TaxID=1775432 RepID=UPI0007A4CAC1|nr:hypothetical protein [Brachybacterium sp. sponge]